MQIFDDRVCYHYYQVRTLRAKKEIQNYNLNLSVGSDEVLEDMSLASRILEDIFIFKVLGLGLGPSPSPWPGSCTERSSKFLRACISKGCTSAVKNFSKVIMNELTQVLS